MASTDTSTTQPYVPPEICSAHKWPRPCPWCRIAELEGVVRNFPDNYQTIVDEWEAGQNPEDIRKKVIADVLALQREVIVNSIRRSVVYVSAIKQLQEANSDGE